MTYKIWNGQDKLFDIDFYIRKGGQAKECGGEPGFYSEINAAACLEGLFKFVACNSELSLDEFIKDSECIYDLRAWLWETHANNCVILPEAEKRQIGLRLELKDILDGYCKKYGFQITTD